MICHIAAMDRNRVIGANGGMPWRIPGELAYFKEVTMGHCLIMGRKTFESIGKALPGRLNLVVSRNSDFVAPGAEVCSSLDEAINKCAEYHRAGKYGEKVFIAGGGELYRQSVEQVDLIYLTRIDASFDGDTFYPEIEWSNYKEISREPATGGGVQYEKLLLERIR